MTDTYFENRQPKSPTGHKQKVLLEYSKRESQHGSEQVEKKMWEITLEYQHGAMLKCEQWLVCSIQELGHHMDTFILPYLADKSPLRSYRCVEKETFND